jgi:hypothetical protein
MKAQWELSYIFRMFYVLKYMGISIDLMLEIHTEIFRENVILLCIDRI